MALGGPWDNAIPQTQTITITDCTPTPPSCPHCHRCPHCGHVPSTSPWPGPTVLPWTPYPHYTQPYIYVGSTSPYNGNISASWC